MANDPNTYSYSSSTVMSYSNDGRGEPKYFQASKSTKRAPGGVSSCICFWNFFFSQLHVYVVVQFYPWFKFSFLLFLGMVMYDNNMIMSLKQKKRKFEPRIKLNHNIYLYSDVHAVVVWLFRLTRSNLTPFNIKSVLLIATEWMNCRLFFQHLSSFFMLYRVLTELWILEKFWNLSGNFQM